MNNSTNYNPNMGFCVYNDMSRYVSNVDIRGFKIMSELVPTRQNVLKMYSSIGSDTIFSRSNDKCTFEQFKSISNKIIKKILDDLRYNTHNNINIDKIINEVLNDGKETSNSDN